MTKPPYTATLTLNRSAPVKHTPHVPASASAAPVSSASADKGEHIPVVQSEKLLQGGTHLQIVHNGATYQLSATRFGKLIITK